MQTGPTMTHSYGGVPYCFVDSYWCLRKNRIDQTKYIKRLVAHFGGVRHIDPTEDDDDDVCPRFVPDRFACAIRQVTVDRMYRPVRDLKSYERLFTDCIFNDYSSVVSNLQTLRAKKPAADPTQPLAVLAAQHGHVKIFRYCLDNGAVIDLNLARAAYRNGDKNKNAEMDSFLDEHMDLFKDLLRTRKDETGDLVDSEIAEFDDIEW